MNHGLICIPYDSGHRNVRMGAGPLHLVEKGVVHRLKQFGAVTFETIEADLTFPTEIGTAFELHRSGSRSVCEILGRHERAIVLSGNCNSSLGTVAGIQRAYPDRPLGVIWFDGHGDCNTPETFDGDFLDAMGLSTLTGRCWQALARTVPGFEPLPDENIILIGGHGADAGARSILAGSNIRIVPPKEARLGSFVEALDRLHACGIETVYLHIDMDVLDRDICQANEFAPTGGLSPSDLIHCLNLIVGRFFVAACGIASFDPSLDRAGIVTSTCLEAISTVTEHKPRKL